MVKDSRRCCSLLYMTRQSSLSLSLPPAPPLPALALLFVVPLPAPLALLPRPANDVFLLRFAGSFAAAALAAPATEMLAEADADPLGGAPSSAPRTTSSEASLSLLFVGLSVARDWLALCLKRAGRGVAVVLLLPVAVTVGTTGEE